MVGDWLPRSPATVVVSTSIDPRGIRQPSADVGEGKLPHRTLLLEEELLPADSSGAQDSVCLPARGRHDSQLRVPAVGVDVGDGKDEDRTHAGSVPQTPHTHAPAAAPRLPVLRPEARVAASPLPGLLAAVGPDAQRPPGRVRAAGPSAPSRAAVGRARRTAQGPRPGAQAPPAGDLHPPARSPAPVRRLRPRQRQALRPHQAEEEPHEVPGVLPPPAQPLPAPDPDRDRARQLLPAPDHEEGHPGSATGPRPATSSSPTPRPTAPG